MREILEDGKAEIVVVDRAGNYSLKTLSYKAKSAAFNLTADDLDYGQYPPGMYFAKSIIVKNTGQAAATITSYIPPADTNFKIVEWPSFPVTIQPGKERSFHLGYQSKKRGQVNDKITFITSEGDLTVNITAWQANLLEMSDIDFGKLKVGEEKILNFKVENAGRASMKVVFIDKPMADGFTALDWPASFTLDSGKSIDLPVKFVSQTAGIFTQRAKFYLQEGTQLTPKFSAIVETTSDVERVYDPSFNIAPNPATGFTTINLPVFKSRNPLLKIYDALGNEVRDFSGKVSGDSFNFDTRTLPNGTYFVRFTDGKYPLLRTFVVSN